MKTLLISFCFLFAVTAAFADDDFSQEKIISTQITPSLYMLEGAGGNMTASIGPDGTLLVDCDFLEMSERLVAKLKELGGRSPRFIINTHFHYDHTGANQIFGASATIIAATEVRNRLMSEQILWSKTHPAFPHVALPILTFQTSLNLHVNEEEIEAIHYPYAHTDGDTAVYFDNQKVVSMGDLYFSGMYPIFHPEHKGGVAGYLDAIKAVLKRLPEDARVVPGHGPLSNKTELERYKQMIEASVAEVKEGMKKRLSLEQIQRKGLSKEWDVYSHGYRTTDQWIESIYKSLHP